MLRSLFLLIGLSLLSGCAALHVPHFFRLAKETLKAPRKSLPLYAARTATLQITFGIPVLGVAPLAQNFVPDMTRAPMWLNHGAGQTEIGVVGSIGKASVVLGFSGPRLAHHQVILADFGPGIGAGRLLDLAAGPDHNELAIAVARDTGLQVDIAELTQPVHVYPIADLRGTFDGAQLSWLSNSKLALLAHAQAVTGAQAKTHADGTAVGGLYLITSGEHTRLRRLDTIRCGLSPLVFSPRADFAVAQGDAEAPPRLINLHDESCRALGSRAPIRVLGWAPNSAAFLYVSGYGSSGGVFRFDMASGRSTTIAISSAAAAYAADQTIVAFGSQQLSWERAAAEPERAVKAEIALFAPSQSEVTINSLGFLTQPLLMAQSSMTFSRAAADAIIDTAVPGVAGPVRELIEYSYATRAAFVIARGAVQGPLVMSWSPDGHLLAMVDGNAARRTVEVLAPPK